MATSNIAYGSALTPAITSASSLASDTSVGYLVASSAQVDNSTSTKALDYTCTCTVVYPNSAPTVAAVYLYVAAYDGSAWSDDGYADAPDGTDQTVTIGDPSAHAVLGTVPVLQNKTTVKHFGSIANSFGGVCPQKFTILLHNGSGQTLTSASLRLVPITLTTA